MTTASYPANYKETEARAFKEADEFRRKSKRRDMGIFDALNENIKAKDQISFQANEQRKTAKDLAELYKRRIYLTRCTRQIIRWIDRNWTWSYRWWNHWRTSWSYERSSVWRQRRKLLLSLLPIKY
mgnify:CR=1 FL=1